MICTEEPIAEEVAIYCPNCGEMMDFFENQDLCECPDCGYAEERSR